MKYLIIIPDGAADEKIESLEGRTPLEAANLENINELAKKGAVGLVRTIPDGISPGSDAANLSVMGYDPRIYLTGRSPLEAVSMGIDMSPEDVAFRCNLVTLTGEGPYEEKTIIDHSAGDITTEEACELIEAVNQAFETDLNHFYTGVSYRHVMIVENGSIDYDLIPPHDILGRKVTEYMPKGNGSDFIRKMMVESFPLLCAHPVNQARIKKGLNPANSIWIWGQGKKPRLDPLYEKYRVKGATISAVDLIKGIGVCAGLKSVHVPGATGTLHTNFEGKASSAIDQFKEGMDFVYVHVEAPDECSHQGDVSGKVNALELIDRKIVKPLKEFLSSAGEDYKILILPDHETPIRIRTHGSRPVPFLLYDSRKTQDYNEERRFSETAGEKGPFFENGYELTDYFFKS